MSEKAVGRDWKMSSKITLRHAAAFNHKKVAWKPKKPKNTKV